jgi:hypothetical protein
MTLYRQGICQIIFKISGENHCTGADSAVNIFLIYRMLPVSVSRISSGNKKISGIDRQIIREICH